MTVFPVSTQYASERNKKRTNRITISYTTLAQNFTVKTYQYPHL